MGREFELKFAAAPETLESVRAAYGDFKKISMETTYYDIPSGELGRRHWTLRRRMENGISVCTVKTPCENGGRGEWEVECDSIEQAIPMLIAAGVPAELAELTADGIVATCGARFTRQAKIISCDDGTVELALDQGVLLGGGKEMPLCELEVELKEGTDVTAILFAKYLAAKYGLVPEHRSKLARARSLAAGEKQK